eukprot:Platyproteum_vivax@DN4732_c0_g1_i2.p1
MELVEGPSVAEIAALKPMHEFYVSLIMTEVLKALAWVHQLDPPMVHRDVKGSNILVSIHTGAVYLVDFGSSKNLAMAEAKTFVGTQGWIAPEMLTVLGDEGTSYSACVDIWSAGCTAVELLTAGKGVRKGPLTVSGQLENVLASVDPISEQCWDFLRSCLTIEPANRPSAMDLLKHAFLSTPPPPPSGSRPSLSAADLEEQLHPSDAEKKWQTAPIVGTFLRHYMVDCHWQSVQMGEGGLPVWLHDILPNADCIDDGAHSSSTCLKRHCLCKMWQPRHTAIFASIDSTSSTSWGSGWVSGDVSIGDE